MILFSPRSGMGPAMLAITPDRILLETAILVYRLVGHVRILQVIVVNNQVHNVRNFGCRSFPARSRSLSGSALSSVSGISTLCTMCPLSGKWEPDGGELFWFSAHQGY